MKDFEERLAGAIDRLSAARELDQVTPIVRHCARELTRSDGVTFILREGDHVYYADEEAVGPLWKGRRFPIGECLSGWVMLNRRPAVVVDVFTDPRVPHSAYRNTFVKSVAIVPVRDVDPIAAIGAYWATPHEATEQELRILEVLAHASAVALGRVTYPADEPPVPRPLLNVVDSASMRRSARS